WYLCVFVLLCVLVMSCLISTLPSVSTLFPYTTLFRSLGGAVAGLDVRIAAPAEYAPDPAVVARAREIAAETGGRVLVTTDPHARSEEHTSELQSRENLVCRLLLEKKKKKSLKDKLK